jgi:hypothetical protein
MVKVLTQAVAVNDSLGLLPGVTDSYETYHSSCGPGDVATTEAQWC